MKIRKFEINLIYMLLMIIIAFILSRNIKNKNDEYRTASVIKTDLEADALLYRSQRTEISILKQENEEILLGILEKSSHFIPEIKQEEIIVLLEALNDDNNFEIVMLDFSEMSPENYKAALEEASESTDIEPVDSVNEYFEVYQVNVGFVSDYESIVDYVKRINDLNKSIFVHEVIINNNNFLDYTDNITEELVIRDKSTVMGTLSIVISTLPELKNLGELTSDGDSNFAIDGYEIEFNAETTTGTNPFIPYEQYIAKIIKDNQVEIPFDNTIIDNSIDSFNVNNIENFTNITGFEKNDYFFVGSPKDVTGTVGLNNNSYKGMWSAELIYNFMRGGLENTANLVFDSELLVLRENIEKMSLKIYSPQYSYHSIGAVILDSSGKQHDITFTDGVYWTDWNTLEANVPNDIHYPAVINRIYVKDNAEKSNLSGYYLFDDLEVLYTKDIIRGD